MQEQVRTQIKMTIDLSCGRFTGKVYAKDDEEAEKLIRRSIYEMSQSGQIFEAE